MDNKISVIIADDNKEFCEVLMDYFNTISAFEVVAVARDGEQALSFCIEHQPDVLLLDMIMPRMDGLEVLKQINALEPKIKTKIIIFSAVGKDNVTKRAIGLGADYYLIKPIDLELLEKRIHDVVDGFSYTYTQKEEVITRSESDKDNKLEYHISRVMNQLGIPAHIRGYLYLRKAIGLVVNDISLLGGITKTLYPKVAEEFDTTDTRVERAIRHAIEVAWDKGRVSVIDNYFGYTVQDQKGKPTNGEFIAMVADHIRMSFY